MVKNNVPKSFIIKQFSISRSTSYNILKNEEKFIAEKGELGLFKATKTNKKVEGGWFEKLDSTLYIWISQECEKGSPITGLILFKMSLNYNV